jgi:hypothetical protein
MSHTMEVVRYFIVNQNERKYLRPSPLTIPFRTEINCAMTYETNMLDM